jgi:hypothetical protein
VFKKIKSSISHRALNRRRYIPFEKTTKLEYEVLEKWLMPPISEEIRNRILLLPKFYQGLDKAKKSGGWSSKIVFNKKIFLWRVSYFSYWKPIYKKFYEVGGHSQNIKSLELRKYLNVEYISQYIFVQSKLIISRTSFSGFIRQRIGVFTSATGSNKIIISFYSVMVRMKIFHI